MPLFVLLLFTHYFPFRLTRLINSVRLFAYRFREPTVHTPHAAFAYQEAAKCTFVDLWFLISGVSIFCVSRAYFFIFPFFTLFVFQMDK